MELKLEDLMTKCEKCNGEGKLINDMPPSVYEKHVAEHGRGSSMHWGDCEVCYGKGTVITASGQAVLDFLYKHYR